MSYITCLNVSLKYAGVTQSAGRINQVSEIKKKKKPYKYIEMKEQKYCKISGSGTVAMQ